MLYFNTPIAADREMFSEAAAENAGTLRLDIFMPQITQGGASRAIAWRNSSPASWSDRFAVSFS